MFAGPRLDRKPTVTQFCVVGAIRPEFATEQQQPSAPCCIFVSLKMAGSRGDPARGRLVDRSVFSFISAEPQAIEFTRPGSVPIQGLRQPWTGTDRRRGVGEEGRMRTSPTSPILAEICDLDEVFTRDVRDIPMQTP
jgi:hypothetical protein